MKALTSPIVVTGLMGAGKTSVASAVASLLGCPLHDSDTEIERVHGRTAREIVDTDGREALHRAEAQHLLDALESRPFGVIAAAASVVDRADCRTALAGAFVVWLSVPPEVLAARFGATEHRPQYDPSVRTMLDEQLAERGGRFASVADLVVDSAELSAPEIAHKVVRAVGGARVI